jgi:hypothetical protein
MNLHSYAKREGRSLRRQPLLELAALHLSNIGIIAYIVSG